MSTRRLDRTTIQSPNMERDAKSAQIFDGRLDTSATLVLFSDTA
jgi:hypothetical protein